MLVAPGGALLLGRHVVAAGGLLPQFPAFRGVDGEAVGEPAWAGPAGGGIGPTGAVGAVEEREVRLGDVVFDAAGRGFGAVEADREGGQAGEGGGRGGRCAPAGEVRRWT